MDLTVTAIVIIAAGVAIAVLGAFLSTRTSRGAAADGDTGARSDLAVAVAVFGIVIMLFGAGCLGFLLLTLG